ncbi:TIGR04086 family membrane protein [Alkalibaculum sp. M08DMB]|uniref:TIGR04086 family membrane protein n=1 Tax=Alkalibaculum sporogenes TaxID=2655001 RepID=A0A6A7K581_9FIRM|nr:TIGR04086 family membrane protein [Alkalibaculum sporogenes]MPW24558.1 TIGR04086 family membrane protein [Alkalibaculum sporogenes]
MRELKQGVISSNLTLYLRGLIYSFGLALVLVLILTTVFFFIDLNSNLIGPLEFVILLLTVLYASIFISRKKHTKGWLHGIVVGSIYFFIFMLINLGIATESFQLFSILPKWFFFASTGFLGGCIGVNIR